MITSLARSVAQVGIGIVLSVLTGCSCTGRMPLADTGTFNPVDRRVRPIHDLYAAEQRCGYASSSDVSLAHLR